MTKDDKKICFYCLDTQLTVCVCLNCRTKLEMARDDLARLKKDQEFRKGMYWKNVRARNVALRNSVKNPKKG